MNESKSRIETLMTRVSELEGSNLTLSQKLGELAQNMEDTNSAHRAQLGRRATRHIGHTLACKMC